MAALPLLNSDCSAFGQSKKFQQTREIKSLCKDIQNLEQELTKLEIEIETLRQNEKTSAPVVKSIYEILTRCFTLLYNLQRFSPILVLNQKGSSDDNDGKGKKNDLVLCSIIIKNFSSYFKSISTQLGSAGAEIKQLKQKKKDCTSVYEMKIAQHKEKRSLLMKKIEELSKTREENVIQSDVVYHIATKSESLDELEAELEAENTVGILKGTKISGNLSLAYPVCGKIVAEFGDHGPNGEMIHCISLETRPGAIVTSPSSGVVVFCGRFLNYGNIVIISNGDYRVFLYGLSDIFVSVADIVEIGDYIGEMKMMARPVVKMELKKSGESLDPRHWMQQTLEKEMAEKSKVDKTGNVAVR
ncbi:MAG: peptidoglycan DD-metalloendopeptidase family protein [Holosporaceae bacterium]|nr:peptidoglycan DD-metalloendopeptidase family protein [Holosporaceae bacterium]